MKSSLVLLVLISVTVFFAASRNQSSESAAIQSFEIAMDTSFALTNGTSNFYNYANQEIPSYVNRDNTPSNNRMNDTIATLGRVLFYDKNLSANNTIACASCHKQEFAFGDLPVVSEGLSQGLTERHTMRLLNIRYGEGVKFFWDERAPTLEEQTTEPIKDHIEMGFSGEEGDPTFEDLIQKLEQLDYYKQLFSLAFGDPQITETRLQFALAQFVRSIQSFDSKYDEGRAQVNNDTDPFPNFTAQENEGKRLYMTPKYKDGVDCQVCHRAPIFDVDPGTSNNGLTSVAGDPTGFDPTNTKSPSLRDLVNPNGKLNGPLMHDGSLNSLAALIEHYNKVPLIQANRTKLDGDLLNPSRTDGQDLQLTQAEKDALIAFLKTLTGSTIYTDERWSNPFDERAILVSEKLLK